jgi:hypothetical protein
MGCIYHALTRLLPPIPPPPPPAPLILGCGVWHIVSARGYERRNRRVVETSAACAPVRWAAVRRASPAGPNPARRPAGGGRRLLRRPEPRFDRIRS